MVIAICMWQSGDLVVRFDPLKIMIIPGTFISLGILYTFNLLTTYGGS
jgi:hypothetical protein